MGSPSARVSVKFHDALICYHTAVRFMLEHTFFITPCACAAGGRVIGLSVSLSMSVCPSKWPSLSSEGLVEGLFQDRSVRIT